MDAWLRSRLRSISRLGVPAVVEEDEEGLDMMLVGDGEVLIYVLFERLGFVLPNYATEIDAHEVESQLLCPTQFTVDGGSIKGGRLPHFYLVDSAARLEITSCAIRMRCIPLFSLFFRPRLIDVFLTGITASC